MKSFFQCRLFKTFWLLLFCVAPFAFTFGQQNNTKVDSLQYERVGFSTLFKVTATGNKEKPFQLQLNSKAVSFIQSYMDKQGASLIKMKSWARPYFNLYDEILMANGIPVELKYLSVIESHLSSNLVSWAGAVGPWQIMPEEATRLGLKLTPIDERTDYIKSTKAAATILKELFAKYGDWLLVVAAYNGGAGRVNRAIQKVGSKDFWKIEYELPLETRNHVKKFIATHYVFESEDATASNKKGSAILLSTQIQEVEVAGRYKLSVIAQYLSIDPRELAGLDPQFDQMVSAGKTYKLKLPSDRLKIFEARKNDILQASLQSLYVIQE